jgi:NADH-quinone oxidoreductase E subunit
LSAPAVRPEPTAEECAAADAKASFDGMRAHLDTLVARYPVAGAALLPVLWHVQRQRGWLTPQSIEEIAAYLDVPQAQVEGVITFYTMFHDRPTGQDVVMVCKTLSCRLRGAQEVMDALEDHFGIEMGGTTADGRYTIEEAECLGLCDMAPCMLVVDADRYGDLTPESAVKALEDRS